MSVKWPKPKRKENAAGIPRYNFRRPQPGTEEARRALTIEGRSLDTCEECESTDPPIQVHHIDGNPYNNHPNNLSVLCRKCHQGKHGPSDEQGTVPWYTGAVNKNIPDEGTGTINDQGRTIKVVLTTAVFRCLFCNGLTQATQSDRGIRVPTECAHCKRDRFELVVELSKFRDTTPQDEKEHNQPAATETRSD